MNDQAQKLRLLIEKNHKLAQTIAVLSGKGGVGKSNVSVNLALSMMGKGNRVLLIDMDIGMGNIHLLIGEQFSTSLIQCLHEQKNISNAVNVGKNGLHYISGGTAFSEIFSFEEHHFRQLYSNLEELMSRYDYILFDMGAGFTNGTLRLVMNVEYVFLVTTPEATAITDGYAIAKYLSHYKYMGKVHLIVNKCSNEKQGMEVMDRFQLAVERFLQLEIEKLGFLLYDNKVQELMNTDQPLIPFVSQSINKQLIHTITSKFLNEETIATKSSSFLSKLKNYFKTRG